MWPVVRETFPAWSAHFESRLGFLFLDVKGLVSTGVGILLEPLSLALGLPWRRPDGSLASAAEIADAWNEVKARQDLAEEGGGHFAGLTTLRLSDDDVDAITLRKLDEVEAELRARFPAWERWPADAQLGTLSMAWAMGAGFRFPHWEAAVERLDFDSAAAESHMSEEGQNESFRRRNAANAILFRNAARVVAEGLPRDVLVNVPGLPGPHGSAGGGGIGRALGALVLVGLVGAAAWYATRGA